MVKASYSMYDCDTTGCTNRANFYCPSNHNQTFCNKCVTYLYSNRDCKQFTDAKQVSERSAILMKITQDIETYGAVFGLGAAIPGFDEELTMLKDSVIEYKERVSQAIDGGLIWLFTPLFDEGIKMKHQIDTGYLFREYSIYKANRDMMSGGFLIHGKIPRSEGQVKEDIDKYKEKLADEMEKVKEREVEQIKKKLEESMMEKHKDQIDALKQQLNEEIEKQSEESKSKELYIEQLEEQKQEMQKTVEKYLTQV